MITHRLQCAAAARGCRSALLWQDEKPEVDAAYPKLNGWRPDGREWLCGLHESEYVIYSHGLAGRAVVRVGADTGYLKTYDPEAHDGRGYAEWTDDVREARTFATPGEAFECWRYQSVTRPLRPDGRPNRPLTAFTIEVRKGEPK